jgi:hypothetical protein
MSRFYRHAILKYRTLLEILFSASKITTIKKRRQHTRPITSSKKIKIMKRIVDESRPITRTSLERLQTKAKDMETMESTRKRKDHPQMTRSIEQNKVRFFIPYKNIIT